MKRFMLLKTKLFQESRLLRLMLIASLSLMCVGSVSAGSKKTYYAKVVVAPRPIGAGTVYVSSSTDFSGKKTDLPQSLPNQSSAPNFTFYLSSPTDTENYKFLGWSTNENATSGYISKTDGNYKITILGSTSDAAVTNYYAHFAKKFFFKALVKVDDACAGMGSISASYNSSDAASWGASSSPTTNGYAATSGATSLSKTLYVKAQTAEGHTFLGWYIDGAAAAVSTELEYNIPYESTALSAADAATKNVVAKFKVTGEKSKTAIGLNLAGTGYDGESEINVDVDNTFTIEMENAPSPLGFSITQISTVDAGESEPVLVYTDGTTKTLKANRAGKATFHITQAETEDVTGKDVTFTINVQKRTPQWEYVAGTMYENTNVSNPIRIIDGRAEWTFTSGNTDVIPNSSNTAASFKVKYLNNHQTQVIPCTFQQDANYKYNAVNSVVNVTVQQKPNHVPISSINAANIDMLKSSISNGSNTSSKNGYTFTPPANTVFGHVLGYGEGYVVVAFEGVPDKLTCTLTGGTSDDAQWTIAQSANGSSWTTIKSITAPSSPYEVAGEQLAPTTRYIKFTYGGVSTAGVVKNLQISELHFSSSPNFVICPIGSSEPQQIKITCANVTEISHSFPGTDGSKFNVTTTNLEPAGYDEYVQGTANITTTATETMSTQWTINLKQVGGASEQAVVDVYACAYPMDLPMDIATRPNDYYYFYYANNKTTYNKTAKKIEFESASSTNGRSVEFYFTGIPGDISFTPKATAYEGAYWNIYEKANKEDSYTLVRTSYLVSGTISAPLSPTSHYAKIEFAGVEGMASLTNLKITKGVYIRSNHSLVSFASGGAISTTCTLTTANVNNLSVSMQNGTNYSASLSGNTLTITRTGSDAAALYDMVVITGASTINNATITKYIPVNTVPSTITATNANNTGIKTGTRNNAASEWASTSYTITDINVSGAFSDGKAFCDKMYIFDKSYNETNPASSNIAVSLNNLSLTSCHIYNKSGDNYVYSKTIENACAATKDGEFDQTSSGNLKLYFTGFCPMLSVGYTKSTESALYIKGNGGTSTDIYLDNCFITPRKKTVEGYGEPANWETDEFPEGSAAALCFQNANNSGRFTGNIHLRGRNMLYGGDGMRYHKQVATQEATATQQSAPIMVLVNSTSSQATINIDDIWPMSGSEGTERTNGALMLNKGSDNRPSIDLGNSNTILNFNGGQVTLKNAYPGSSNYTTTLAISHRSYTKSASIITVTLYGMGNDQVGGTVNFNDGTISGIAPNGFHNGTGTYDSYFRDADGNLDGTALRCPQNTYINGGSFNCNISACSDVQSQGGSPTNSKGDLVCMLDLRASGGVDEKGFAIFDFPYSQVSKTDHTTTLAQYYTNKSTDYGHASLTPKADPEDENKLKVHLFLPCDYTERSADMDYTVDIWKYAFPSMEMGGPNADIAASVLGLPSNDLGGPATVNTVENYTKNILWGRLDEYMRAISTTYEIEDEFAGQPISGVTVTLGEEDYSYVTNAGDYTIRDGQYLLFAVKADKYLSLCPPFDVKNIYVVESYPENMIANEATNAGGQVIAIQEQAYANLDYCYQLAKAAVFSHQGFSQVNSNFKTWGYKKDKEKNGYSGTQSAYNWRGVKKIYPFISSTDTNKDFYLYENQEEWTDHNGYFTCNWGYADNSDGIWMEKGKNYILQFPAKTANEYWDYWTGKMIIFEGLGEETIQGSNAHATIKASATPSGDGKAVMLGNTTLAEMTVQNENLFYYDEESGMFLSEPEASVKIQPAQGFLYARPLVDPEAPVDLFGIEAYSGKCWYFLTYDENEISVELSGETKTYKGLDSNDDGTKNNRYIYRNDAWVEMTDTDGDHAWDASNSNTYIYYADAWVIVTKTDGVYTDGSGNKYYYDETNAEWVRMTVNCGVYTYDTYTFLLINEELIAVTPNANDAAYLVNGSDPAAYYLDADGSCAWIAVSANSDQAYYDALMNFYVYFGDEWVSVERIMDNPNWNHTYIDASSNYYISNDGNWLKITGPDENHLWHGSDMLTYIYYGNPADWVAVTHHEGDVYTDNTNFYQYNTTSNKWEVVVADLTVDESESYIVSGNQVLDNLTIKAGGEVIIPGDKTLEVNNLIINATPDANQSGIVTGATNLVVDGNVYLDITMNSTGEMDATKYYSFAVPFTVNRANGVQRLNKNTGEWETATFGANYLAYEYNEAERAANGASDACWTPVASAQYEPGKFYLCEFDNDNYNVYRFKASDKNQLNPTTAITVNRSATDAVNAGWNGIAGKGISFSRLNGSFGYMFALNSAENAFNVELAHDATLAVGHAVFVQATEAGIVTINQTSPSAAPARVRPSEAPIHCVRITESGKQKYDDQLFVSASEEALPEYVAGKDVQKQWMGTPKVARIWVEDYNGLRLAANDAVLVNDQADCQLGISAPKKGEYVLALQEAYDDVTVYLTHNGIIVANLTIGEYPISLEKGETTEYGLRIVVKKAPNVATDFDAAIVDNPNGVHKVIINDVIYIIKNKHVYTTNGQIIK